MMELTTEFDIVDFDGVDLVDEITWTGPGGVCKASIRQDDHSAYTYTSQLVDDTEPKESERSMSLADCILAASVHLGMIPPHNFEPIDSPNQH